MARARRNTPFPKFPILDNRPVRNIEIKSSIDLAPPTRSIGALGFPAAPVARGEITLRGAGARATLRAAFQLDIRPRRPPLLPQTHPPYRCLPVGRDAPRADEAPRPRPPHHSPRPALLSPHQRYSLARRRRRRAVCVIACVSVRAPPRSFSHEHEHQRTATCSLSREQHHIDPVLFAHPTRQSLCSTAHPSRIHPPPRWLGPAPSPGRRCCGEPQTVRGVLLVAGLGRAGTHGRGARGAPR